MKVYFTSSARGKEKYGKHYSSIYSTIEKLGHKNIDDLIFRINEKSFYRGDHKERVKVHKHTIANLRKCDILVLEATVHSLSMGYLLRHALELEKPVIVLYLPGNGSDPFFATGIENDKLQVLEYSESNLEKILKLAFEYAKGQIDSRFNFFISSKIGNYLNWIARKKKTPRAVYLRRLIEREMKENKEYSESK